MRGEFGHDRGAAEIEGDEGAWACRLDQLDQGLDSPDARARQIGGVAAEMLRPDAENDLAPRHRRQDALSIASQRKMRSIGKPDGEIDAVALDLCRDEIHLRRSQE